jgi:hypothetical protein
MCGAKEVAAARAAAKTHVDDSPPAFVNPMDTSPRRKKRMLNILRIHFETAVEKFEEHSDSLRKMSINSFVSQAKRNTYKAEDMMGKFREMTLAAAMKRMEVIMAACMLLDDRRRRGDGLFTGWECPGISAMSAVMRWPWMHGALVMRMRTLREKTWLTRATKLTIEADFRQRLEDMLAAAVAAKNAHVLSKVLSAVRSGLVMVGGVERDLSSGEFPNYEMFRTGPDTYDFLRLSAAKGYSRPMCDNLCKILQNLPGHLDPFLNINVVNYLVSSTSFFAGLPASATNRCPSFKNNTKGDRQGSFPDISLKHPEVIARLRMLVRAMKEAGFPRVAPRSRRPARGGDATAAATQYVGPNDVPLLRIPPAAAPPVAGSVGAAGGAQPQPQLETAAAAASSSADATSASSAPTAATSSAPATTASSASSASSVPAAATSAPRTELSASAAAMVAGISSDDEGDDDDDAAEEEGRMTNWAQGMDDMQDEYDELLDDDGDGQDGWE